MKFLSCWYHIPKSKAKGWWEVKNHECIFLSKSDLIKGVCGIFTRQLPGLQNLRGVSQAGSFGTRIGSLFFPLANHLSRGHRVKPNVFICGLWHLNMRTTGTIPKTQLGQVGPSPEADCHANIACWKKHLKHNQQNLYLCHPLSTHEQNRCDHWHTSAIAFIRPK